MIPSPYIELPTIPEGMTIREYRITRPAARISFVRRVVGLVIAR
jgi:hypothetical protein